jgi:predicted membrane protein
MENTENTEYEMCQQEWEKRHRRGKLYGGIFIVIIGSLFLLRELGFIFPPWLFTWKMLLIVIGVFSGFKNKFRNPSWLFFILIGSAFLLSDIYPELSIKPFIWPVLVILVGLTMIFKRKRHAPWKKWSRHHHHHYHKYQRYKQYFETQATDEDSIESVAVMSGIKKNILTKNFKGGEVTVVFGGSELNLSQADFNEKATLEINQVFGGTKLIIPAHWEIKSELVSIFGSVDDKRSIPPINTNEPRKVLTLTGSIVFGGIEIKSY